MNKIVVIADSTVDLSQDLVDKYNIVIVPLHVSFPGDEKLYSDGVDLHNLDVFKKVKECGELPKTNALNVDECINLLQKYYDEGYDIIFTGIGSQLSSNMNNMNIAKTEFEDDRIELVDSENLSTGSGLIALKICELRDQGKNIHEIAEEVKKYVPLVSAKFCIDRLDYLYKGGRCSGMTRFIASTLKLHPICRVTDGKLSVSKLPMGKYRRAINDQLDEFRKELANDNVDTSHVFVTDTQCMDGEDEYVIEELAKLMPRENIHHTNAGCVISSHAGPKTLGILYLTKGKTK